MADIMRPPPSESVPPTLSAQEAVHALRRLIALDGAFYPCLAECDHLACEVEMRVLNILDGVA